MTKNEIGKDGQFEETIAAWLDELAELREQMRRLKDDRASALCRIIPAEVQEAIDDVEAEFAPKFEAVDRAARELEARIKAATRSLGKTVQGTRLQAVFQTRTSWDNRALNGYAAAHPEVLRFRRQTKSVSIRSR
ncbi:MAG TPA: hypothetical protein EYH32_04905 [Anaerolineae bacterium]|nr:hypothetical protein [Anaerolineae bacterium]